jgi:hypothetical protein
MPKQILGFESGVQDRPIWIASLGSGISGLSCPTSTGSGCWLWAVPAVSASELAANSSAKLRVDFPLIAPSLVD